MPSNEPQPVPWAVRLRERLFGLGHRRRRRIAAYHRPPTNVQSLRERRCGGNVDALSRECWIFVDMEKQTQISALLSKTTKDLLEQHVKATGLKKGYVVEAALRHHLQALQELPSDVIVRPKIVVSRRSAEEILARMAAPRPTPELRALLADDGD